MPLQWIVVPPVPLVMKLRTAAKRRRAARGLLRVGHSLQKRDDLAAPIFP
jgi:hypothetical protein